MLGANDRLGHRHNPSHATTLVLEPGFLVGYSALVPLGKRKTPNHGRGFFTAGLGNLAVAFCLGEMGRKRCIGCDCGQLFPSQVVRGSRTLESKARS